METLQTTITEYKRLLEEMSAQYESTVAEAHKKMQGLIDAAERQSQPEEKPESVWIEKDGEKYLLMNETAVDHMNTMFDKFKSVIEELVKKEQGK